MCNKKAGIVVYSGLFLYLEKNIYYRLAGFPSCYFPTVCKVKDTYL